MAAEHMAIDQYGKTYHALGPHPRKGLLERLNAKSASPIYRDKADGHAIKVGWIVKGLWCTIYKVEPFEK